MLVKEYVSEENEASQHIQNFALLKHLKKKKLARNFILFYMLRIRSIYAFSLIFYSHLLHKTGRNSILFTKESPISPPK